MLLDGSLNLRHVHHGIVNLRLLVFHDFLRAAQPWALAEDVLHILCHDHLFLNQQFGKGIVTLLVLHQNVLGTGVLLVHHLQHLLVYLAGWL